jgi:hypothetical protein
MRVLKPSRKRLRPGDVFVLQPDEQYLFGRVIKTGVIGGGFPNCILIYIYNARSASKEIPLGSGLLPNRLLVPPITTNRLPWSRGYFELIARVPLEPSEVLEQHCFRSSGGKYYDEAGHQLAGPVEPVGVWGVHSYRTIDDAVSDALGIPRVPD